MVVVWIILGVLVLIQLNQSKQKDIDWVEYSRSHFKNFEAAVKILYPDAVMTGTQLKETFVISGKSINFEYNNGDFLETIKYSISCSKEGRIHVVRTGVRIFKTNGNSGDYANDYYSKPFKITVKEDTPDAFKTAIEEGFNIVFKDQEYQKRFTAA
jgi:hypothetical protein